MGGLILILILVSPTVAFCIQENEPGIHAGPSRAPLAITAAGEGNDDFQCGECPNSNTGDETRWHGSFLSISSARKAGPGRRGPTAVPKHGLGPVLSALCDTLILSRPPPRPAETS